MKKWYRHASAVLVLLVSGLMIANLIAGAGTLMGQGDPMWRLAALLTLPFWLASILALHLLLVNPGANEDDDEGVDDERD
jgi:hypothetical protein